MLYVNMEIEFDPSKINISCAEMGMYCPDILQCRNCPFSRGNKHTLADILYDYGVMTALKADNDDQLDASNGWQSVVENLTDDLNSYIADHKASIEECDCDHESANDHYTYISAYKAVLKDLEFLVHKYIPKEYLK